MTVERGIDPRGFALMPFGGAGPLHAAALARALGMRRILVPRASGVLCALGLAAAAPRRDAARTVMLAGEILHAERLAAEREALWRGHARSSASRRQRVAVRYELRYRGQSFELAVEEEDVRAGMRAMECSGARGATRPPGSEPPARTHARSLPPTDGTPARPRRPARGVRPAHEQRYGYRDDGVEIELVTIRVSAWGAAPPLRLAAAAGEPAPGTGDRGTHDLRAAGLHAVRAPGWRGRGRCAGHRAPARRRRPRRDPRPDRAAGPHRRVARRMRGDGRRADPLRALAQHQGAPRLPPPRCSTHAERW